MDRGNLFPATYHLNIVLTIQDSQIIISSDVQFTIQQSLYIYTIQPEIIMIMKYTFGTKKIFYVNHSQMLFNRPFLQRKIEPKRSDEPQTVNNIKL